jgi:hypothetical protein
MPTCNHTLHSGILKICGSIQKVAISAPVPNFQDLYLRWTEADARLVPAILAAVGSGGQSLGILLTIVSTYAVHNVKFRADLADLVVHVNGLELPVDEILPW